MEFSIWYLLYGRPQVKDIFMLFGECLQQTLVMFPLCVCVCGITAVFILSVIINPALIYTISYSQRA